MPPASPRSASAGGWMPRTTERRSSSASTVVSRASRSSAAAASGSVAHQLLGEPDVHADRGDPGLGAVVQVALDPAYLGGAVVQRLACARPAPPRPGARAARPGVAEDVALGRGPGPDQRRGGAATRRQQRPVEHASEPPPEPAVEQGDDEVDDRRRPAARPGHRQHDPPVAGEPQEADVAPAGRSVSHRHRPGDQVGPVVSAYAGISSSSSAPLTRRWSAVSALGGGHDRERDARTRPRPARAGCSQDREDAQRQRGRHGRE